MISIKSNKQKWFLILVFLIVTLSLCSLLYLLVGKAKDLRSLSVSEPLIESQILELTLSSSHMGREMPFLLYLPKGYGDGTEYPVLYGLHGYGSDQSMWIDNGIATAADELMDSGAIEPMIMVFPYTKDASFKEISKDLEDGKIEERNIDKFICNELVPHIDSHYYTVTSSDGRYIAGFSMGGMIALRIAFHHTDVFSKVGGYSAAVISSDYSGNQLEEWLYPNDNFEKMKDISDFDQEKGFDKLTVYLDAGNINDPFSEGLQSLYQALLKRGIQSEFELFDGGHTLRQDSIKDYLKSYAGKN